MLLDNKFTLTKIQGDESSLKIVSTLRLSESIDVDFKVKLVLAKNTQQSMRDLIARRHSNLVRQVSELVQTDNKLSRICISDG